MPYHVTSYHVELHTTGCDWRSAVAPPATALLALAVVLNPAVPPTALALAVVLNPVLPPWC